MKMLKRLIVCIVLLSNLCVFYSPINAQDTSRVYRKFLTLDMQQRLEDSLPSVVAARQQIEQFTDSVSSTLTPQPVTLPIVFHIMNPPGESSLISEAQVHSQIEALNRDFNNEDYVIRHPADTLEGFSDLVAYMEISFCLADYEINGMSVSPIHYIQSSMSSWPPSQSIKDPLEGGAAPWNPEEIINVWIADLEEDVCGFAQMPGGPTETDGIVIDYKYFGNSDTTDFPYNQGKTLTHLIGNYLNLYDLWGTDTLCSDDQVDDTPIHNAPNYGSPVYKHVTTCNSGSIFSKPIIEMTMNFMDNSDDVNLYMFTQGQKLRVHSLFEVGGARSSLVSGGQSNCTPEATQRRLQSAHDPITEDSLKTVFTIYPNPVQRNLHLIVTNQSTSQGFLRVFSSLGSLVLERPIELLKGTQEFQFDVNKWSSGIYFVQLKVDEFEQVKELIKW